MAQGTFYPPACLKRFTPPLDRESESFLNKVKCKSIGQHVEPKQYIPEVQLAQTADKLSSGHREGVQDDPKPAPGSENSPNFGECLRNIHVGQGKPRNHKVELTTRKWQLLPLCTEKMNVLCEPSAQLEGIKIPINPASHCARGEIAPNQGLPRSAANVENTLATLRDEGHDSTRILQRTGDAQFQEMVIS